MEGLNLVSGIEVGFGGVWVGAAPYLLFIPHDEKTDKAGEPKVLLDGWGFEDTHETLNTFVWGPDGWLYGCHGVFTHSRVGKPGAPDAQRVPINAGVWRYHPTKHIFEVFAEGTSNPWGLDYNDSGDFFVEACVIPHCFHIIQGARYLRQAGWHFNPHTYADIGTIADHLHYVGANPHDGNNKSDQVGGGHAHCGLMCYLGGSWPAKYRGQLFMGNIHGKRLNMDVPRPKGSGYVAGHGPDFLLANDEARFVNLKYGPTATYLIDWYDRQACHHNDPAIWDRTNGRVYKVSLRGTKPVKGLDLKACSDVELAAYQSHDNDWYVRQARKILQERVAAEPERAAAIREALARVAPPKTAPAAKQLRHLWAMHAVGGLDPAACAALLGDAELPEQVRAWAVQLALEERQPTPEFAAIGRAASRPCACPPPIASGLQRIQLTSARDCRGPSLTQRTLPTSTCRCLHWYALEPVADRPEAPNWWPTRKARSCFSSPAASRRKQHDSLPPRPRPRAEHRALLAILRMSDGFRSSRRAVPQAWRGVEQLFKHGRTRSVACGFARSRSGTRPQLAPRRHSTADAATRQQAIATLAPRDQ